MCVLTVTTTEIYTKFEESELIKGFPIEASRLDCEETQATDYNYEQA